ncbi:MAG: hypothetical protein CMM44_01230 [Rhodospirillaceae bacterium]|nr:hypothetical protein [Rhodospirillaceae bacterium]|tara:strand:+ start:6764 stop:7330 length:567 start_codon:yes stop_codon:yes gene_type:complete
MDMHGLIDSEIITKRSVLAQHALDEFCRETSLIIQTTVETDVPTRIAELLPKLVHVPNLLTEKECTAPNGGYGRNNVYICPTNAFSILSMVWPAGIETPIHDHRDWCALGVYEGEIEECYFTNRDPDVVERTSLSVHKKGNCNALPWGAPNIHRIANRTGYRAISIHVYGGNCERQGPNVDSFYSLDN